MRRCLAAALVFTAFAVLVAPASAPAASLDARLRKELRGVTSASGISVRDLRTGRSLAAVRSAQPRRLASLTKLYTAAAVLSANPTLTTQAVAASGGPVVGNLTLVGGGDPVFGSAAFNAATTPGAGANVETLADQLVAGGLREITGRVLAVEGRFDTLRGPAGPFDLETGGSLSAVAFNRGRADDVGPIQAEPAPAAALALRRALTARGVVVRDQAVVDPAVVIPRAAVSTRAASLVKPMLKRSDNWIAEMLVKGMDPATPATTSAGARAVAGFASSARPPSTAALVDGSGIGAGNRAAPKEVVDLLEAMAGHGAYRSALPVAGRDGTLADRMRTGPARGRCFAKTGTIPGATTNLAGYCKRRRDGHMIAFALLLAPRGDAAAGERVLDRMAAIIAR